MVNEKSEIWMIASNKEVQLAANKLLASYLLGEEKLSYSGLFHRLILNDLARVIQEQEGIKNEIREKCSEDKGEQ